MMGHNTDGSDGSDDSDDSDSDNDDECDVVWAKSGRGLWGLCHVFQDTLFLTCDLMEGSAVPSNVSVPKVSDSDRAATSAHAKKSPKPGEHVQLFRMKRDRNKGFYSEKCQVEVSIALCFEWAGCLVPRDALPLVHNIVARTEHCVQRTLPARTVFFWDIIIRWTRGGVHLEVPTGILSTGTLTHPAVVPLSPAKNNTPHCLCRQFPPETPNQCVHPEVPNSTLTQSSTPHPPSFVTDS